jgi:hypothetical protein
MTAGGVAATLAAFNLVPKVVAGRSLAALTL